MQLEINLKYVDVEDGVSLEDHVRKHIEDDEDFAYHYPYLVDDFFTMNCFGLNYDINRAIQPILKKYINDFLKQQQIYVEK